MFRKLWLLIWKNLVLRRRHWVVTTFEVLLPTICACIVAYSSKKLAAVENTRVDGNKNNPTSILVKERRFEPLIEEMMVSRISSRISRCYSGCPYAPSNNHTAEIMKEMQDFLSRHEVETTFFPMSSEQAIEDLVVRMAFNSTSKVFDAAFVFQSGFPVTGNKWDNTVAYKIRLKFNSIFESLVGSILPVYNTETLFSSKSLNPDSIMGRAQVDSYVDSGFIGFQLALDQALIKTWNGKDTNTNTISLQPFPIPSFVFREEQLTLSYIFHSTILPTFLVLGFIFIVPSVMLGVVNEKETGIRELLKMSGVSGWLQWLGWLVNSWIIFILSVTIVIIFLFLDTVQHGDPAIWYLICNLYLISATSFCFFVSSFFNRPVLATIVGVLFWLVSYFPVFILFEQYADYITFSHKMLSCLLPNVAFHLAVKIMMTHERDGVGVQWSNVFTPDNPADTFTLGHIFIMLCVSTAMFFVLTVYLENVLGSEFGVKKPWYYIFLVNSPSYEATSRFDTYFSKIPLITSYVSLRYLQPSTWGITVPAKLCKVAARSPVNSAPSENQLSGFEEEPTNVPVGIRLDNLRKEYNRSKVAIDGVTLNMFEGEIFVLLGHNGAGKTTLISLISGISAPTNGNVEVNGFDVKRQLEKVREHLGLCPQQNMLFDKLTVQEHFLFFGRLKGLSGKGTKNQLEQLMQKVQLWEKRHVLSKHLSGGQKRKLHLGIALLGHKGVSVLDEPSSGMDPEARRAIWDVLLQARGERTILLTTHFMEEADVLGDRIAIMASGKIQCCGSSSFLKHYYGTGYTLKISLASAHDSQSVQSFVSNEDHDKVTRNGGNILEFVQKYVPNAFLETHSANASEIWITLPTETATTTVLSQLFSDLPNNKEKLGIETVGMSRTTIEDVFLRVGELTVRDRSLEDKQDIIVDDSPSIDPSAARRSCDCQMLCGQFMALLLKKILYTYRKRKLIFSQIIVPVLLLMGAILSCNGFFDIKGHPKPLVITLDAYSDPVVPVLPGDNQISQSLLSVISSIAKIITPTNDSSSLGEELMKIGTRTPDEYNGHYIVGAETTSNLNVLYNTRPNHAAPLAINLASNTILRQINPKFRIQVTNHPFSADLTAILGSPTPDLKNVFYTTVLFEVFMPIGLALLAATFVVLPIEEKWSKAKQLQMMTGVPPAIYWAAAYLWDFVLIIFVASLMTCCFPIFQGREIYTSYGGAGVAFLILTVYGICAIPFSYLVSLLTKSVHGGFALVTIIHLISGLVIGIVVSSTDILAIFAEGSSVRRTLQLIGRLFPTYGAVISTTRFVETAIDNSRCSRLTDHTKKQICDISWIVRSTLRDSEYLECCDGCKAFLEAFSHLRSQEKSRALYTGLPKCFEPKPYITWENERETFRSSTIFVPGIAQEFLYMMLMAGVYILLLLLIEYRHFILYVIGTVGGGSQKGKYHVDVPAWRDDDEGEDVDVREEKQRVVELVGGGDDPGTDALVISCLRKKFGGYAAVQQVSVGVHHGECFGLLGVNGAGKTTTFRIITGDVTPSDGQVFAFGKSLKKQRAQYLAKLGYCPQFDGIIPVLTGKEMLLLFCGLRGISGKRGKSEVDKWLRNLGLSSSAKVQCKNYSGGMKRRLCAGMAMIGSPAIILLDEPTSGVDPVSRRQFWKVLQSVRDSGQAVILTSHSMEECEALCSRLGIMVNGELQCLGGVQHLKSKFAQGYSLAIKLNASSSATLESDQFLLLQQEIMDKFQPCTVKDKHNNFIQYHIHNTELPWEFLFKVMEELKEAAETEDLIEDYSLTETTLEEVFLSFARMQHGGSREQHACCLLSCCD